LLHNANIDYQPRQSKKSELGKKRSELKEIILVAGIRKWVMEAAQRIKKHRAIHYSAACPFNE